ncbi:MAG: hypothetical protein ACUZ9M_00760 [Candidatus Scalindua sp.]
MGEYTRELLGEIDDLRDDIEQLQAELATLKSDIALIFRYQYIQMPGVAKRMLRELADKIKVCSDCGGRRKILIQHSNSHDEIRPCEKCAGTGLEQALKP